MRKEVSISLVIDLETVHTSQMLLTLIGVAAAARNVHAEVFINSRPWKEWANEHLKLAGLPPFPEALKPEGGST